ncbi:MAG: type secretion system protein [Candidatus Doudnabacteria bacterium]|nr:type secretion system protein [Candidatus Doudnabacteria bacterium]
MLFQDDQKQKDFLRKFSSANRKMEEDQAAEKSLALKVPYIDLSSFPVDLNAMGMWSARDSKESSSVIFFKDGNDIRIGSTEPHNPLLKKLVQDLENEKFKSQVYFISQSSLKQMFDLFDKIVRVKAVTEEVVKVQPQKDYIPELKVLENKTGLPATQILATIFGAANNYGSSDIHIEPEETYIKVRFRMDGVLQDVLRLSKDYQKTIVSRIKILSKLKLNIENVPQDGRLSFTIGLKSIDVRVSILPSVYGEGIVMRVLSNQAVNLHLDDLGFVGRSYDLIKAELEKPNGMIITTGPTGSGKTTTLYAFLNQLNEPGVKIITLEDPVEYKLEGINQTPIGGGLTFASGLRSILRQDPDVVMVGEIRDQETAEVALQAALTGHVVLSTLHTNDAAGAIPRLENMGVKPFVIAPGLNAIIAQRLVRLLCKECKQEKSLELDLLKKVKDIFETISSKAEVQIPKELKFYSAKGCQACNKSGYKGRLGIYEVIVKSDLLEKLIMSGAGSGEIKKAMLAEGMITMMQDGLLKALQGLTDVEEVFRVTQE